MLALLLYILLKVYCCPILAPKLWHQLYIDTTLSIGAAGPAGLPININITNQLSLTNSRCHISLMKNVDQQFFQNLTVQ